MRKTIVILGVAGIMVVVLAALWMGRSLERKRALSILTGDPKRGGAIFFSKGCGSCHAVSGTGGNTAPDLGRVPEEHQSLAQLVGVMWNHAPAMWAKMQETRATFPVLRERDMVDVLSYLYTLRYTDEAGDMEKGARLFQTRGCVACHAVRGEGGTVGPDLTRLNVPGDPIAWARRMWNHAGAMEKATQTKGIPWPEFHGPEMGDLLAYMRSVSAGPSQVSGLLPANPEAGKVLFSSKGCVQCHALHNQGGSIGPDLGRAETFPRTITSMVGNMWNHSPRMSRAMEQKGLQWPQFTEREMVDLVAYLFSVRYFDEPGDIPKGRRLFSEKRCDACHSLKGERKEGPDLGKWRGNLSPVVMAYAMWNHGPEMYRSMQSKEIPWPRFSGREMADLLGFLNSSETSN